MPAFRVGHPLVHVGDELVADLLTLTVGDQAPLVGFLLLAQRMAGREDRRELLAEKALGAEAGGQRPDAAAQDLLAERRARELEDHRTVEEQGAGDLEAE